MTPYYQDNLVTLYHGDCLEIDAWREADVLVTDPPYGIGWVQPEVQFTQLGNNYVTKKHEGIANDDTTMARDSVLTAFGTKPQMVFGSPLKAPPTNTKQVLFWKKPNNSGIFGTVAGYRRDVEVIYLLGTWPKAFPGKKFRLGDKRVCEPRGAWDESEQID